MELKDLFEFMGTGYALGMMLVGFCFIIFIHELGHFLAAKMVNMKVTQFALGIGPAIFAWRKGIGFRKGSTEPEFNKLVDERLAATGKVVDVVADVPDAQIKLAYREEAVKALGLGETEYRVNWLVILGGYVKLEGQEDLKPDAVGVSDRSFTRKPAWARAVVLSAGVFMNFISGIVFFIIAFTSGVKFPPAVAGYVEPGSPAAVAYAQGHEGDKAFKGIKTGDHITAVDGDRTVDFTDITLAAALSHPGDTMDLTVQRPGVAETLTYRLAPAKTATGKFLAIGITDPMSLTAVFDPAEAPKGVKTGSTIVAIDDKPVTRYDELLTAVEASHGKSISVTYADPDSGAKTPAEIQPAPNLTVDEKTGEPSLLGLVPVTRVMVVVKGSPADKAGITAGDLIARVGAQTWPKHSEVSSLVKAAQGRPIEIVVWRDGAETPLGPIAPDGRGLLGIRLDPAYSEPLVSATTADSPLASAGLNAGSRILSVNGEKIGNFTELAIALSRLEKPEFTVGYRKNLSNAEDATAEVSLGADSLAALREIEWTVPRTVNFDLLREPIAESNPIAAAKLGLKKTYQFMAQTYLTLVRLFQQTVPVSELRGVVGIAHEGTKIAKHGWSYLCFFLGLISVNLVVMNFLPIPILDGGQMLFLIIEKCKGSPVSIRVQEIATYVGLAIILSLVVVTLYYDTGRLLGLVG
ncbi:MAG: site-2 protease family protein [Planctomycetota bacterium]|nr:site-2 protease family protein [Planctomycetota bacterium]